MLDLIQISSISVLNPNAIPDIIFPLNCGKIHEYADQEFVLHCKTMENNQDFVHVSPFYANQKEIIYFIQRINGRFFSKFYFDFYEEKYLKVRSILI